MSLLIGYHVKQVLDANAKVRAIVGERVFPVVNISHDLQYPFIVYTVGNISEMATKDGSVEDSVSVAVGIVSKDYDEAISLAHSARYALEYARASYQADDEHDGFEVRDCVLAGFDVDYNDDLPAYIATLLFEFKTLDY